MDYKTLSNGVKIPSIGYGTYKTPRGGSLRGRREKSR